MTPEDQMQMVRDLSEIKGMLSATLSAHDARITAIEADIDDSRSVHTAHDTALSALGARMAVVENTSNANREQLAKAADQSRANAALIVSIVVGIAGIGAFLLNLLNQIGMT